MRTADLFRLAAANLRENPLRTVLCALSVAVGTGALLLIASIGLFGQTQVQAALRTIGVSGLTVYLDGHGAGNPLSCRVVHSAEPMRLHRAVRLYKFQQIALGKGASLRDDRSVRRAVRLAAVDRADKIRSSPV